MEVFIATFLDALETVDVLTASNNDVKHVKTQSAHLHYQNPRLVLKD